MALPTDLYVAPPSFVVGQQLGASDLNAVLDALIVQRGGAASQEAIFVEMPLFAPAFEGSDEDGTLYRHQQLTTGAGPEFGVHTFEGYIDGSSLASASGSAYGSGVDLLLQAAAGAAGVDKEILGRIRAHRTAEDQGEICISAATDDGAGGAEFPTDPADEHLRISANGDVTAPGLPSGLAGLVEISGGVSTELSGTSDTEVASTTLAAGKTALYLVIGHVDASGAPLGYVVSAFTPKVFAVEADLTETQIGYVPAHGPQWTLLWNFFGIVKYTAGAGDETIKLTVAKSSSTDPVDAVGYLIRIF